MAFRIAHLTSVHPGNDTRILLKECFSLSESGYDVTLVARPPEFRVDFGPVRFVEFNIHGNRAARMMLGSGKMMRIAIRLSCDLYHFHDPELIPVGMLLKVFGKKVIYDVHEDVPSQVLTKPWIPRRLRRPVSKLVSVIHSLAGALFDTIVVAREDAGLAFEGPKMVLVQNYPLMSEFVDAEAATGLRGDVPSRVTYIGGISEIRGIHEMISGVDLATKNHSIRLDLAGPFQPKHLKHDIEASVGWKNVDYYGWVDRTVMGDLLSQSVAGLLLFHPVPNHLTSYPNKLFEYMSAGVPVIASNFEYWKQFISEPETGILVDPLNPDEIANAISWIIEHPDESQLMGERGKALVKEHYNWETEVKKLVAAYESVLGPNGQENGRS